MATFRQRLEGFFGFAFQKPPEEQVQPVSIAQKTTDDGAMNVAPTLGAMGTILDLDLGVRSDNELINRYRQMAEHAEVDSAIEEIVNEMINSEEPDTVKLVLDDLQQSANVKKALDEVFSETIKLLDFRHTGYNLVRRWYTDSRLYFHVIIDPQKLDEGIQELRFVDPRKIKKVREVEKVRIKNNTSNGQPSGFAVVTQTKAEYFVFNDSGFQQNASGDLQSSFGTGQGAALKIAPDAIVYVTSGLTDPLGSRVVGYLQQAVKPLNQLRMLEDASLIYRLSRAPQRRVWKVEVGNMPAPKAQQYLKDIMMKQKNKLQYDAATGTVVDDRKFQTILEDFWIPTRGGVGTAVEVLPPAADWGVLDDIQYFEKKLYNSLKVPTGRLRSEDLYDTGVGMQITRDEIKFAKFISRLRVQFANVFLKIMEKQCVLKGIMSQEDFQEIAPFIRFDFIKDNEFEELKNQQIMENRARIATELLPFVGRHISNTWLRKTIFMQSEEDMEEIDAEIAAELMMPQYILPTAGPGASPAEPPEDAKPVPAPEKKDTKSKK